MIARAPNGYYVGTPETTNTNPKIKKTTKEVNTRKTQKVGKALEWREGPPRVGTFSMRATRFRLNAGCLSWETKDGTKAKNRRILSVIPTRYIEANSTKGWRDLSEAEVKVIKSGAMKKPQLGRKRKQDAQSERDEQEEEGSGNGGIHGEDMLGETGEELYDVGDGWNSTTNAQDTTGIWPDYYPQDSQAELQSNIFWPQLQPDRHSMGYYPQESVYHQSSTYHDDGYYHPHTQPPSYPAEPDYSQQRYSQQRYPTHSKRKWEQANTVEHIDGQRPTKLVKGYTFTPNMSEYQLPFSNHDLYPHQPESQEPTISNTFRPNLSEYDSPFSNHDFHHHQPESQEPTLSNTFTPYLSQHQSPFSTHDLHHHHPTGPEPTIPNTFTPKLSEYDSFLSNQSIQNHQAASKNPTPSDTFTPNLSESEPLPSNQSIQNHHAASQNPTRSSEYPPFFRQDSWTGDTFTPEEKGYSPLFDNEQGILGPTPDLYNSADTFTPPE